MLEAKTFEGFRTQLRLDQSTSNTQQQTQGPHLELPGQCQIRQLNPILGTHIQNPSPKCYFQPVLVFAIICQILAKPPKPLQCHHSPLPPPHSSPGLYLAWISSAIPWPAHSTPRCHCCFLLLVTLKNTCIPCNYPPSCSVCSEGTSAHGGWYRGHCSSWDVLVISLHTVRSG